MILFWLLAPALLSSSNGLPQVEFSSPAGFEAIAKADINWLDSLEVDWGIIPLDSAVTATFRFQNNTEAPLLIDNVRTSCGCTASDWAASPTPPGEIGEVRLTFDAAKRGYFRKRATVWFRGVKQPTRIVMLGKVD